MPTTDARIAFCEREHGRLVGSLVLYTGDADLAAELAQEALARALVHWARVSEMDAPGAWLHRVALNLANKSFSRTRAERLARERVGVGFAVATCVDVALALAVRDAVARLPRRQKGALVLRYFADMSVAEVATVMGCAEGTVKALTSQAIANLRPVFVEREPRWEAQHDL